MVLRFLRPSDGTIRRIRLADLCIEAPPAATCLSPFAANDTSGDPDSPRLEAPGERPWAVTELSHEASRPYVDSTFDLAERPMHLRAWGLDAGIRLELEDVGTFDILRDPFVVRQVTPSGDPGPRFDEAIPGPLLLLPLAFARRFCLHASAVGEPARGAVLFMGASGDGKSTLARELPGVLARGTQRLGDDLTIVDPEAPALLPHFPQPKLLPASQMALAALPSRIPLGAVCHLRPTTEGPAQLRPLEDSVAAVRGLVAQTVASRLFDVSLLRAHLEACSRLATTIPHFELVYPHRPDAIGEVATLLGDAGLVPPA